jgi:hypothetical protein
LCAPCCGAQSQGWCKFGEKCWNVHDARDERTEAAPAPGAKRKAVTFDESDPSDASAVASEQEPCAAAISKKVGDRYLLQTQDGREYYLDVSNVEEWHTPTSDDDDDDDDDSSSSSAESEPEDGRFWVCRACNIEVMDDDDPRCSECQRKPRSRETFYERQNGNVFTVGKGR